MPFSRVWGRGVGVLVVAVCIGSVSCTTTRHQHGCDGRGDCGPRSSAPPAGGGQVLWYGEVRAVESYGPVAPATAEGARRAPASVAADEQYGLALSYVADGRRGRAEQAYRRALELYREAGDAAGMARVYTNLGAMYLAPEDLVRAEFACRYAMKQHEQAGDAAGMARSACNLANVCLRRHEAGVGDSGELARAEAALEEARSMYEDLRQPAKLAGIQCALGSVYLERGDLVGSEQSHRKAIALHRQTDNLPGMACAYGHLGDTLLRRGDLAGAEDAYAEALALARRAPKGQLMQPVLAAKLGDVSGQRGDADAACEHWTEALELCRETSDRTTVVAVRRQLRQNGCE